MYKAESHLSIWWHVCFSISGRTYILFLKFGSIYSPPLPRQHKVAGAESASPVTSLLTLVMGWEFSRCWDDKLIYCQMKFFFLTCCFLLFLLNLSCNSYNFLVNVSICLYSKFLSNKMFEQDHLIKGFPRSSVSKESVCNAGDPSSSSGLGRYPGDGNGNPLWYSCLQNPMLREAWQATVRGVARIGHNLAMTPPPFNKKNPHSVSLISTKVSISHHQQEINNNLSGFRLNDLK